MVYRSIRTLTVVSKHAEGFALAHLASQIMLLCTAHLDLLVSSEFSLVKGKKNCLILCVCEQSINHLATSCWSI